MTEWFSCLGERPHLCWWAPCWTHTLCRSLPSVCAALSPPAPHPTNPSHLDLPVSQLHFLDLGVRGGWLLGSASLPLLAQGLQALSRWSWGPPHQLPFSKGSLSFYTWGPVSWKPLFSGFWLFYAGRQICSPWLCLGGQWKLVPFTLNGAGLVAWDPNGLLLGRLSHTISITNEFFWNYNVIKAGYLILEPIWKRAWEVDSSRIECHAIQRPYQWDK